MTSKGENEIISFSISKELARKIEELKRDMNYSGRSELIRDALRMLIGSKSDLEKVDGEVEGILIVVYDRCSVNRASDIIHENVDISKSRMHSDFGERCCDVVAISGGAGRIREMVDDLRALRSVKRVEIFLP
jgi:CopG family nickel-responsive transcriptional regulator